MNRAERRRAARAARQPVYPHMPAVCSQCSYRRAEVYEVCADGCCQPVAWCKGCLDAAGLLDADEAVAF